MRGSGLAVGSAMRSRSWAERLESVLEQDQDMLTLPRMWAADLDHGHHVQGMVELAVP